VPHIVNDSFGLTDPFRVTDPLLVEPLPAVGRIERQPSVIDRRFAQQLVILIKLLPTQIDIDPEVFRIRKVFSHGLVALKLVEKEFKALDNIPNITVRAHPSTLPLANLAIAFKHLNRTFIVAHKLRKDLENLLVLVR
jgi:hypothetical protein